MKAEHHSKLGLAFHPWARGTGAGEADFHFCLGPNERITRTVDILHAHQHQDNPPKAKMHFYPVVHGMEGDGALHMGIVEFPDDFPITLGQGLSVGHYFHDRGMQINEWRGLRIKMTAPDAIWEISLCSQPVFSDARVVRCDDLHGIIEELCERPKPFEMGPALVNLAASHAGCSV